MLRIELRSPEFLNPLWFNNVINKNHLTKVKNDSLELDGVTLKVKNPLPDGTELRVFFDRNFYAVLESEYQDDIKLKQTAKKEADEKRRKSLNQRREEASAFNSTINLPVEWRISQKEVLSGLSERSNGDGCYKNTVHHIELLTALNAGRLQRQPHDFLCTAKKGSNGKSWSDANYGITYQDGDGNTYTPRPTCKQCLKLIEKFRLI